MAKEKRAPQFITPLNIFDMKTLGIITEIE